MRLIIAILLLCPLYGCKTKEKLTQNQYILELTTRCQSIEISVRETKLKCSDHKEVRK